MRPVEILMGPTGVQLVVFGEDGATVWCRNSMTKADNFFVVDNPTGDKIAKWVAEGKPGCIQDVFPELSVDQREQMLSGITPEEWDELFEGEID